MFNLIRGGEGLKYKLNRPTPYCVSCSDTDCTHFLSRLSPGYGNATRPTLSHSVSSREKLQGSLPASSSYSCAPDQTLFGLSLLCEVTTGYNSSSGSAAGLWILVTGNEDRLMRRRRKSSVSRVERTMCSACRHATRVQNVWNFNYMKGYQIRQNRAFHKRDFSLISILSVVLNPNNSAGSLWIDTRHVQIHLVATVRCIQELSQFMWNTATRIWKLQENGMKYKK